MQSTITPEILAEAQRLQGPPEELGIREAARRLGVSKSALGAALAKLKASAQPKASKPPRKPPAPPKARSAPTIDHPKAPADPKPPPPPAELDDDPVRELLKVAAELRGRQAGQPAGSKEFRDLSAELRKTLAQAEGLRLKRTPKGDDGSATRAKGDEAAAKIRSGVRAVAQREAETGKCLRCGADLPGELVTRRRVEAGLADPPMH